MKYLLLPHSVNQALSSGLRADIAAPPQISSAAVAAEAHAEQLRVLVLFYDTKQSPISKNF